MPDLMGKIESRTLGRLPLRQEDVRNSLLPHTEGVNFICGSG